LLGRIKARGLNIGNYMNELNIHERKKYSQFGEDGITLKLCGDIFGESKDGYYVEFGVQDGSQCNTRILRESGWGGLMLDSGYENLPINLRKEFITKDNIVDLFKKYEVPNHINFLSVDIDGNDFYVLHKILKQYTVDVLVCEYNGFIGPDTDAVIEYDEHFSWDTTDYFGASLLAFTRLANKFELDLVGATCMGLNAYFVKKELTEKHLTKLSHINNVTEIFYPFNGGRPKDKKNRKYLTSEEAMRID